MSFRKKIICGTLLLAIIGVGALAWWQRNNISAALSFARFSQEELETKLTENDQAIKNAVAENPSVTIRDVTDEERAALREGTLTQEELVQSLLKPATMPEKAPVETKPEKSPLQKPEQKPEAKPEQKPEGDKESPSQTTQQPAPSTSAQPEKEPEQSEYEQTVNALIAKVFVLREEFLIKLDELQAAAIADYKAIPADQRTTSKLAGLVSGYLTKGLDMEKQCDAQIEAIVLELEQLLQENGGDTKLAQTVYDTYVEEKSLKKAWYMAELKKRGFV